MEIRLLAVLEWELFFCLLDGLYLAVIKYREQSGKMKADAPLCRTVMEKVTSIPQIGIGRKKILLTVVLKK